MPHTTSLALATPAVMQLSRRYRSKGGRCATIAIWSLVTQIGQAALAKSSCIDFSNASSF